MRVKKLYPTLQCAEIMNNFFSDVAINLDMDLHTDVSNASDPVTRARYHPSIIKLDQQNFPKSNFDFQNITESRMLKVIEDLDSSKSYIKVNIPTNMLKDNKDICSIVLTTDTSRCIINGILPNNLKNADITPVFKNEDRLLKTNYRPVSILPTITKNYEKLFFI